MLTPATMLAAIEHALQQPRGPRGTILAVHAPVVLGERGKYLGESERGPVYGLTRRQCLRIRETIHEAARADLEGRP